MMEKATIQIDDRGVIHLPTEIKSKVENSEYEPIIRSDGIRLVPASELSIERLRAMTEGVDTDRSSEEIARRHTIEGLERGGHSTEWLEDRGSNSPK